jgi:hypothetical protein
MRLFNIHTLVSRSGVIQAKTSQFARRKRKSMEYCFDYSTEEILAVWLVLTKLCNDYNPTKMLISVVNGIDF